jgi:hypothetical protein
LFRNAARKGYIIDGKGVSDIEKGEDRTIERSVTSNAGKTAGKEWIRCSGKRNTADRCYSSKEINGGDRRNSVFTPKRVTIAKLRRQIWQRNDQRDAIKI